MLASLEKAVLLIKKISHLKKVVYIFGRSDVTRSSRPTSYKEGRYTHIPCVTLSQSTVPKFSPFIHAFKK